MVKLWSSKLPLLVRILPSPYIKKSIKENRCSKKKLKLFFLIQFFNYIKKLKILIEKIYENQIEKLNFFNKHYNESYIQR